MDDQGKKITKPYMSWAIFAFSLILTLSLCTCSTKNLLNSQKVGSIFVTSTPPGGEIILDNYPKDKVTPDTIFNVSAGDHILSVTKEGYLSASRMITVEENQMATAKFDLLNPSYGSLKVTSNVDSATICIDHQDTNEVTTHVFFNNVTVGTHVISVFKEGYSNQEPSKEAVNIVTEDTVEVNFVLNPAVNGKAVGNITPDFKLEDDYGFWHRLYAYRGFVTMINFWATDCPNCMKELPHLKQIYAEYSADTLIMLAINYWEDFDVIRQTRTDLDLDSGFVLLRDVGSEVKKAYQMPGTPETYILDRGGKVYYYLLGFKEGNETKFRQKLDELFGK